MTPAHERTAHGEEIATIDHLTELALLLDGLSEGAMLCDFNGRVLSENSALEQICALDHDGDAIRNAMLTLALDRLDLANLAVAAADIRTKAVDHAAATLHTASSSYRLRSTMMSSGWLGTAAAVLISIEPTTKMPLDDATVQERFGLTNRELAVARLVATGKTNAEIAVALQISAYTARNHVERILFKLGVPNRTSVSALLLSDGGRLPRPHHSSMHRRRVRFRSV